MLSLVFIGLTKMKKAPYSCKLSFFFCYFLGLGFYYLTNLICNCTSAGQAYVDSLCSNVGTAKEMERVWPIENKVSWVATKLNMPFHILSLNPILSSKGEYNRWLK